MHLLIIYSERHHPQDPILDEFTYGDKRDRGRKLKQLKKGDYVFFHKTEDGKAYVTAYYVVDRVLATADACRDPVIVSRFRSPHIAQYRAGGRRDPDDAILFGDPVKSQLLRPPLRLDKALASQLSLGYKFRPGRSEAQVIGYADRVFRELTDEDKDLLLDAIHRSNAQRSKSREGQDE